MAIGTIGHWFNVRRGFATGLASCAGSLGGVFFNLLLSSLFTSAGYAWATRALGFIFSFLLITANLLIRSRLPGKSISRRNLLPDPRIFKDKTFAVMTAALFLIEWGLFCGLSYLTSFALSAGVHPTLAYQLLSILNAGSFFGRWVPGLLADKIGRFNTDGLFVHDNELCSLASSINDLVSACHASFDHSLRAAFWLRVWKQHHTRPRLRRPAVQDRELRPILCNMFHRRGNWDFGWHSDRRGDLEESRRNLCGADYLRGRELHCGSSPLHVGQDKSCRLGVWERKHFLENYVRSTCRAAGPRLRHEATRNDKNVTPWIERVDSLVRQSPNRSNANPSCRYPPQDQVTPMQNEFDLKAK